MRSLSIRDATLSDLGRLSALENDSFRSDRLSARSLRRLIGSASAACRVVRGGAEILGYYLLLFRAGTRVARLYSIAVDRRHRGEGVASSLMANAERAARRRGRSRLRLEVRDDNRAAIRLYERLGYRLIGRRAGYYADNANALRYEKRLDRRRQAPARSAPPLRRQGS
jgi:ribosomal protein S18 acetylase RimI-like enzyme